MTKPQLYTAKMTSDFNEDEEDLNQEFTENGFLENGYVTGQLIYDNLGRPVICDNFELDENGFYSDGSYVVIDPKTLKKVTSKEYKDLDVFPSPQEWIEHKYAEGRNNG